VPRKRETSSSSEKPYQDFRYFSTEQMRALAEMFKEVAGISSGGNGSPQQQQKQFSTSDLSEYRHSTIMEV